MRYYDLRIWHEEKDQTIYKETTSKVGHRESSVTSIGHAPLLYLSSYVKRRTDGVQYRPGGNPRTDTFDPGALDISFEIIETDYASPTASNPGATIAIKGIDPETISAASRLTGATIELRAGMGHGLPLTKPEQAGTILYGTVSTAFGNWVGANLSLTIFVAPYGSKLAPKEPSKKFSKKASKDQDLPSDTNEEKHKYSMHIFECPKGGSLKQAITHALTTAYPKANVKFSSIDDPHAKETIDAHPTGQVAGIYKSFKALCVALSDAWEQATRVGKERGERLCIVGRNGTFFCYSEHVTKEPIKIAYEDLIGQPTWTGDKDITFCCPLRADLNNQSSIILPEEANLFGPVKPSNTSNLLDLPKKRALLFHGTYRVKTLHHIGDFRNPDGQQWMTVVNCTTLQNTSSSDK